VIDFLSVKFFQVVTGSLLLMVFMTWLQDQATSCQFCSAWRCLRFL